MTNSAESDLASTPLRVESAGHEEETCEPVTGTSDWSKDSDIVKTDPEESAKREVIRVMLWTAPRSLSTAFERCMTRVPNAKIFNEMYAAGVLLGPNRKVWWWPKLVPKHSYKYCKARLEAEHKGYDFVFAKDFAIDMHKHTDMLPKGYQHTFLIRHPKKMFASLRKTLCSSIVIRVLSNNAKIKNCFPTDGYFFEDMWELYKYFHDHPDYPVPIIMDADDIIRDPEGMIRRYCETIGLPFSTDILNWEEASLRDLPWEGAKFFHMANWMVGCYENALKSTGFMKKNGAKKAEGERESGAKGAGGDGENGATKRKHSTGFFGLGMGKNSAQKSTASVANNVVDVAKEPLVEETDVGVIDGATEAPMGATPCPMAQEEVHSLQEQCNSATVNMKTYPEVGSANNVQSAQETPELDLSGLHSDVRKAVKYAMPFYEKLYERRIVLDKVPHIN